MTIRETMASLRLLRFYKTLFLIKKVLDLWRNYGSAVAGNGGGAAGSV